MHENDDEIHMRKAEDLDNPLVRQWYREFLKKIGMTEEEYEKMCLPYIAECREVGEITRKNRRMKKRLQDELIKQTAAVKKSIGGEILHRGFYCPSIVEEIINGNCRRGRLCRENNPRASFTYYFDSQDRLIGVEFEQYMEYISYQDGKSLGLKFNGKRLCDITLCEYDDDGRIKSYALFLANYNSTEIDECDKETYTYAENKLIVDRVSFMFNDPLILSIYKYVFTVKDGYLYDYVVDVSNARDISNEPLKGRYFKVKIKRKI